MRRLFTIIALASVLVVAAGCSAADGFKVTSCSVASLTPSGLRAVKAVLKIGITNPMPALTISKVNGVIHDGDREVATFNAGKLSVDRRCSKVYPLACSGAISKEVGLGELLKIAATQDFESMTVDLTLKIRLKCGLGKTLRFKDIKVTDLLESDVAAAYLEMIINEAFV